jgi:hypothetical protein
MAIGGKYEGQRSARRRRSDRLRRHVAEHAFVLPVESSRNCCVGGFERSADRERRFRNLAGIALSSE